MLSDKDEITRYERGHTGGAFSPHPHSEAGWLINDYLPLCLPPNISRGRFLWMVWLLHGEPVTLMRSVGFFD